MKCKLSMVLVTVVSVFALSGVSLGARAQGQAPGTRVMKSYGRLPLSFEINRGQTDARVKFLARGRGYTLFLTSDGAALSLRGRAAETGPEESGKRPSVAVPQPPTARRTEHTIADDSLVNHPPQLASEVVWMKLQGANPHARVVGLDNLPGVADYFLGNNSQKWRTNVPTYARVKYEDIYPGIDLVYYGNQGHLEYDFVVHPGANPKAIRVAVATTHPGGGAASLHATANGDLVVPTGAGNLRFGKPIVYQTGPEQASGRRFYRKGHYAAKDGLVAFVVPDYDASLPLVIDPTLDYSSYLGGSGPDGGNSVAVAVDSEGNAYVASETVSPDFPAPDGAFQAAYQGGPSSCTLVDGRICGDAFVTKINPSGSAVVYSTYLGGGGLDMAYGLALDDSGNAYVTGDTDSPDFPTTQGAYQTTFGGDNTGCATTNTFPPCGDVFVTKLDPSGSTLVYSTYLGGSSDDYAEAVALDDSNNAYVTGISTSANYPTTAGAFQMGFPGANLCGSTGNQPCGSIFVTKMNATGTALAYSTFVDGANYSGASGVAVDSAGDAYITGNTYTQDFPTTNNAFQITMNGTGGNVILSELDPNGSSLLYSTYLAGTSGDDFAFSVAVDDLGDAYISGVAASADFPVTSGAFQTSFGGGNCGAGLCGDAFVAKFDPSKFGTDSLLFSTFLGGSANDLGTGVAVDAEGNVYIDGQTFSPDFPTASAIQDTYAGGGNCPDTCGDAFVAALDPTGSKLLFSTYLGGNQNELADFVALDSSANIYAAGYTSSTDYPVTDGAFQTSSGGDQDVFVAKISAPVNFSVAPASNSTDSATITAGQTATYTLALTPQGGFDRTVDLACNGAPADSTCSVSPSSLTLDGTDSADVTVSVATTAPSATLPLVPDPPSVPPVALFLLASVLVLLILETRAIAREQQPRRLKPVATLMPLAVLLCSLGWMSCGGGGGGTTTSSTTHTPSGGTAAGTYTITVTGTSGSLSHDTALTLNVN